MEYEHVLIIIGADGYIRQIGRQDSRGENGEAHWDIKPIKRVAKVKEWCADLAVLVGDMWVSVHHDTAIGDGGNKITIVTDYRIMEAQNGKA